MRSSKVSALAEEAIKANASAVIVLRIGYSRHSVIPGRCEASNPESEIPVWCSRTSPE